MIDVVSRYEIVFGESQTDGFAELWDRSLAPGGLAFEFLVSDADGSVTVIGHGIPVPWSEFDAFIAKARAHFGVGL